MLGSSAARSPRARSAFTSSRNPAASMASKRCAMRWCNQPRSAGSSENNGVSLPGAGCCAVLAHVEAGPGPARHPKHFQRPLDALRVAGRQPRRGRGVDPRQFGMQRRPALARRLRFQFGAHGRVGLRHRVESVEPGLEVQHGAAHQQRELAAGIDLAHQSLGVGQELGGAVGLQRIADVDQVVRHAARVPRPKAWRCRCPCRGRPAPSRH